MLRTTDSVPDILKKKINKEAENKDFKKCKDVYRLFLKRDESSLSRNNVEKCDIIHKI